MLHRFFYRWVPRVSTSLPFTLRRNVPLTLHGRPGIIEGLIESCVVLVEGQKCDGGVGISSLNATTQFANAHRRGQCPGQGGGARWIL